MKPIQCAVCHKFFDAEKFEVCPHCAAAAAQPEPVRAERHALRDLFCRKKKEEPLPDERIPEEPAQQPVSAAEPFPAEEDSDRTIPASREDLEVPEKFACAVDGAPCVSGDALYPVVGWLVCVHGAYKGRSFELHAGESVVGSARDVQVALPEEADSVCAEHACVTYDTKKKSCMLQSLGEAARICINGTPVTSPAELKSFDEIAFGEAVFVFVRLCSRRFSWEKYEK